MDRSEIAIDAPPAEVWTTLSDGPAFEDWVVGCQAIRDVEGDWPEVGSAIHHRVGAGVLALEDSTTVVESERERRLVLRARIRPAGVAMVHISLEPGPANGTTVVMEEEMAEGPASHVPDALTDPLLHQRNVESLQRLKQLVEDRVHDR